jgi:hypothetical protein
MRNATTTRHAQTSPPATALPVDADQQPDRRTPKSRTAGRRTPVRPGHGGGARPPLPALDRASHPEDVARNERLARSLAANAGRTHMARHRERVTAIENEEDGIGDDEEGMAEAAQAMMDADADGVQRRRALS